MQAFDVQGSSSQALMKTATQNRVRAVSRSFRGLKNCGQMVVQILEEKESISINQLLDLVFNNIDWDCVFADHEIEGTRKNINRRVYDVLSVMEALGIICKNGKIIEWMGFMTQSQQEIQNLKMQIEKLETSTETKLEELGILRRQVLAFKALLGARKGAIKEKQGTVVLPFIAVKTNKETSIECRVSGDKFNYIFMFNEEFDVYDSIDILPKICFSAQTSESE